MSVLMSRIMSEARLNREISTWAGTRRAGDRHLQFCYQDYFYALCILYTVYSNVAHEVGSPLL